LARYRRTLLWWLRPALWVDGNNAGRIAACVAATGAAVPVIGIRISS
jgi:hypothetical protein